MTSCCFHVGMRVLWTCVNVVVICYLTKRNARNAENTYSKKCPCRRFVRASEVLFLCFFVSMCVFIRFGVPRNLRRIHWTGKAHDDDDDHVCLSFHAPGHRSAQYRLHVCRFMREITYFEWFVLDSIAVNDHFYDWPLKSTVTSQASQLFLRSNDRAQLSNQ